MILDIWKVEYIGPVDAECESEADTQILAHDLIWETLAIISDQFQLMPTVDGTTNTRNCFSQNGLL